ncbi:MAG TPA: hypothetical protein VIV60_07120, partial [Polyangiaceae bacterium]
VAGDRVCCIDGGTDQPGAIIAQRCDAKSLSQRTLDACRIAHSDVLASVNIDVPTALTGPNWAIKAEQCSAGGWDLSQCAGTAAMFTSFAIGASSMDQIWVVSKNDQVCCVYGATDTNPGIVAATCMK